MATKLKVWLDLLNVMSQSVARPHKLWSGVPLENFNGKGGKNDQRLNLVTVLLVVLHRNATLLDVIKHSLVTNRQCNTVKC